MAGIARKVGSKDSRFLCFRSMSLLRFRALSAFIEPRLTERKERRESRSRSLSPLIARGEGGRTRTEFFASPLQAARRQNPPIFFISDVCIFVSLWRIGFERDSDNGKLEDLVRLALKRLNVSYLTILSRLVWFERKTLVCHERGCEEDICDSFCWISNDRVWFTYRQCAPFSSTISFIH